MIKMFIIIGPYRFTTKLRNMKVDPIELYTKKNQEKELDYNNLNPLYIITKRYKTYEVEPGQFKNDRLDFTDMVQKFITSGLSYKFQSIDGG